MFRFTCILFILALVASSLSGCVSEKSYVDSNKQVKSLDFDKQEAAKSRLLLGLEYLRNNNLPQAKSNLDKALSFAPSRADVHYSLAHYYQTVGDNAQANKSYQQALALEPNNPNTMNNYGTFLCKTGDTERAKQYLKQAVKVPSYSQVASTYLNLAYCEIDSGDYKSALESATTASKHDPRSPEIMLTAANLHYAFGNLSNAVSWFQELQSVSQLSAEALLFGIVLTQSLSQADKANYLLEQLNQLFPSSPESALANSNNLHLSEPEILKQKVQSTYSIDVTDSADSNINVSLVSIPKQGTISANSSDDALVQKGVHSLNAIKKENLLPEEEVVYDAAKSGELQLVERTPWLEIQTPKVSIPTYRVQSGENLYRVSIKFNIQISTLMKWNKLKKQQVNTGELLYIRNPDVYHVVSTDEKLSVIADELKINFNDIMRWHNVRHDGLVKSKTKIIKVDPEQFK